MEVALGGTFDQIHDGHRALFDRALELGDLTVGLTSDRLAQQTRKSERHVRSFEQRKQDLRAELAPRARDAGRSFEIRRLEKPTGVATEPRFDVLVVSPETEAGGKRINEIRRERGHDPLDIEVVPHVSADDGGRISSTRIVRGEIDEHGNLMSRSGGHSCQTD